MFQERMTGFSIEADAPARVLYEVPFCPNEGDQCLVANIHSVLTYFEPEMQLERRQVADLCGYVSGLGAWKTQSLLSLDQLGFEVRWIEDDDLVSFATNPHASMEQRFHDPAVLERQLSISDVALEAQRVATYLSKGLPFERRKGTIADITNFLADGWLVRLSVNGTALFPMADQNYYSPHSVLAVGYWEDGVILHNADGINGNVANQPIPWEQLMTAWDQYSGERALNAFRKP